MRYLRFIPIIALLCFLSIGCQTNKQVRSLATLTATNAAFVSGNLVAFVQRQDRVFHFLDSNLQRTAALENVRTNLAVDSFRGPANTKLMHVAESLLEDSENNAHSAFATQALVSPTNSLDASIAAELKAVGSAWKDIIDDLASIAKKQSIKDEAKFLGSYGAGVYQIVQEKQKTSQDLAQKGTNLSSK